MTIGWFLHMGWDVVLHLMGPGLHIVPEWYAYACISFDVLMAGYLVYSSFVFHVAEYRTQ